MGTWKLGRDAGNGWRFVARLVLAISSVAPCLSHAQQLDALLRSEPPTALVADARDQGDARRGAVVFFQGYLACSQCHAGENLQLGLGPDLSRLDKSITDEELVQSVLLPSQVVRKGFETVVIVTRDGTTRTGLLAEELDNALVIRDPLQRGRRETIRKEQIEQRTVSPTSIMPAGQMDQLTSRQQFLDLIRYLMELRDGGPARALELQPDPNLIAALPLPEYEAQIDHAGLIRGWDAASLKRGGAIYQRVCANCHGTHDRPGSLPLSPRFTEWKAKNGNDPYAMYQTLTRGFGFMAPQTWMVPQQKYDVIHYIRETYLRQQNPAQLAMVDDAYLKGLPSGNTLGPEPSKLEAWVVMDYGPSLMNTYEIPISRDQRLAGERPNFAYKGLAMRLDPGPGGVSRGRQWMIFDHDTMRMASVWSGTGFIDWRGIHFDGQHQVHPRTVGKVLTSNLVGPGWAHPVTGGWDDPRVLGRDGRRYGPLPRERARFRGFYSAGSQTVVSYQVGSALVLESPTSILSTDENGQRDFVNRSFFLGAHPGRLTLVVATQPGGQIQPLTGTDTPPLEQAGTIVFAQPGEPSNQRAGSSNRLIAGVAGKGAVRTRWRSDASGRLLLDIPGCDEPSRFCVWLAEAPDDTAGIAAAARWAEATITPLELPPLTNGGPRRWPQTVKTTVARGAADGPFAVDVLTLPENNPWLAQVRPTGFDFFPDGDRLALCTWDGDVWLVTGVSTQDELTWQRIASGLFQPLGLKILNGQILVTCRDQIVRLHDLNQDQEIDFYECFNNDHQVTEHFHEFAMGLQIDAAGNLYYAKSARHALPAVVPHHGTLLRVRADGSQTDILANGFRAANGVCLNPDGSFIVTDQEGHWNPKNRINWVTVGPDGAPRFYGNMFGYHAVTDPSDAAMVQPLCWITNAFDRSPAELLWVPSDRWGPLAGSLLNLSYGYGRIYVVPHEEVPLGDAEADRDRTPKQGGMSPLPLPLFPTGIHRGRFHPVDGQLYACGMFAWAGSATQPGGFYRVRYTGQPVHVPIELHATQRGLRLVFSGDLSPESVASPEAFSVKSWSLKRTADYGSQHYDERTLKISQVSLADDRRTVSVTVPDIAPTWCMEIRYSIQSISGAVINGVVHNTIHRLGPE